MKTVKSINNVNIRENTLMQKAPLETKKGHYLNDKGVIHGENITILKKVCTQQHRFKHEILTELQEKWKNTIRVESFNTSFLKTG